MVQRTFYIYKQPSSSCCPQAQYLSLIQLCIVYVARKCLYCTGWMNKHITNTLMDISVDQTGYLTCHPPPTQPISWCALHTYQLKAFLIWHRAFKFHGSHILVVTDCWRSKDWRHIGVPNQVPTQPLPTSKPLPTLPTDPTYPLYPTFTHFTHFKHQVIQPTHWSVTSQHTNPTPFT